MVRIEEHLEEMRKIHKEIKTTTGYRKKCLERQYNRMRSELKSAQMYLQKEGRNILNGER